MSVWCRQRGSGGSSMVQVRPCSKTSRLLLRVLHCFPFLLFRFVCPFSAHRRGRLVNVERSVSFFKPQDHKFLLEKEALGWRNAEKKAKEEGEKQPREKGRQRGCRPTKRPAGKERRGRFPTATAVKGKLSAGQPAPDGVPEGIRWDLDGFRKDFAHRQ
ncbi:hypothetical protein HOY80DRAFT_952017 [Tuber brumale]|nr:hypothetical protein HOY80DRAFT_951943 [Tuber brumale]KAG0642120.1 hypothetical protein HOY80DRAFT_952017 [Tuber brumale]